MKKLKNKNPKISVHPNFEVSSRIHFVQDEKVPKEQLNLLLLFCH